MDEIIFESSYRLINKYNQKSRKAKTYGTEDLLYPAEVHMLDVIGAHMKVTTTKLAEILGITKGAVSQTTNKLLSKGLIEKNNSKERTNEVYITLSESGKQIFDFHREKHADMQKRIHEVIEDLSPESVEAIKQIIAIIDQSLDEM